jgi:hypothetical protein
LSVLWQLAPAGQGSKQLRSTSRDGQHLLLLLLLVYIISSLALLFVAFGTGWVGSEVAVNLMVMVNAMMHGTQQCNTGPLLPSH